MVKGGAGLTVCSEERNKERAGHAVEGETIDWQRGGGGTSGSLPE
jgi:hypothetical protein